MESAAGVDANDNETFLSRACDNAGCSTIWLLAVKPPRNRRLN
jgi:hypothetical protein